MAEKEKDIRNGHPYGKEEYLIHMMDILKLDMEEARDKYKITKGLLLAVLRLMDKSKLKEVVRFINDMLGSFSHIVDTYAVSSVRDDLFPYIVDDYLGEEGTTS